MSRFTPITRRKFSATLLASGGVFVFPALGNDSDHGSMLWDYTIASLRSLDEKRRARLAALETPEELHSLRAEVLSKLKEMWGPLPERTPLNARVVGKIEKSDHVIERVVFESRPKFFVTANLYRPRNASGRRPAVIVPVGHSDLGKFAETPQYFSILMARQGFVVLTWDPIGQGERVQFYDPEKEWVPTGPRTASTSNRGSMEHNALGNACYLLGINLMQYFTWDAMRAIDYLETRDDVDAERIGCTGSSGGGQVTLQLAPYDPRVKAAIPVSAVTTFRHKTEHMLIADPEQILYRTLEYSIDHPELLSAVAPRAVLIGSPIRDYVPIAGARRTYREVKDFYTILGVPEKVGQVETDDKHSYNQEVREAAATWLVRWLTDERRTVHEETPEMAPDEELQCTSTGQVVTSLGGETVFTLNKSLAREIRPRWTLPSGGIQLEDYRREITRRTREISRVGPIEREEGISIPHRVFGDGSTGRGSVLLVSDTGKDDPEVHDIFVNPLLKAGFRVIGIDVRGWGETTPRTMQHMKRLDGQELGFSWDNFFAYRSLEMGRSLFGQRLRDLLAISPEVAGASDWTVVGAGVGGLLAAHAALLEPRIRRVASVRGLLSYQLLMDDPFPRQPLSSYLPGVIGAYDVRDVYAALCGRKLLVINPEDAQRRPVESATARDELDWTAQVFRVAGMVDAFSLRSQVNDGDLSRMLVDWLVSK